MKIKKILKRCTAAMLAAAIGVTTLAANVSAATTGISIGYTWNSLVNPTIKKQKERCDRRGQRTVYQSRRADMQILSVCYIGLGVLYRACKVNAGSKLQGLVYSEWIYKV